MICVDFTTSLPGGSELFTVHLLPGGRSFISLSATPNTSTVIALLTHYLLIFIFPFIGGYIIKNSEEQSFTKIYFTALDDFHIY